MDFKQWSKTILSRFLIFGPFPNAKTTTQTESNKRSYLKKHTRRRKQPNTVTEKKTQRLKTIPHIQFHLPENVTETCNFRKK